MSGVSNPGGTLGADGGGWIVKGAPGPPGHAGSLGTAPTGVLARDRVGYDDLVATRRRGRLLSDTLGPLVTDQSGTSRTAPEFVLTTLRQAIVDGLLPPGTRLRQEELAETFGLSRIPIREALRVLEHEGLARSEGHRGYTVSTLDADELEDIYDLRIVLESHAARLAVPLLTSTDIADLARLHAEMDAATTEDERLTAHERFYGRLYAASARPRLLSMIDRLRQEVPRSLRFRISQHNPHHHDAFFQAVQSGDADLAVAELTAHYHKVVALLRRYLREAKDPRGPR